MMSPRFNNRLSSPAPQTYTAQNLARLQTDLVSLARMLAVDEVGAAMAHQLNEPLTALLFYLHEMQGEDEQRGEAATDLARRALVERALQETKRLWDIVEQMGSSFEPAAQPDPAMVRSGESRDWPARINSPKDGGLSFFMPYPPAPKLLTPREREVLALITDGISNKEGGRLLGISTRTFEVHRAHIMAKLGARNTADLVRVALREKR